MIAEELADERISLDDWEVGELSIEYDDQEPQEVIRWALETFAPQRIAVCTSFPFVENDSLVGRGCKHHVGC